MRTDPPTSVNEARSHLERCSSKFDRLLEIQHRGLDAYATFATAIIRDAKNGEFAPKRFISAWCDLSEAWIRNGFALLDVFMPSPARVAPMASPAGGDGTTEKPSASALSSVVAAEASSEK